jgi:hypothetical protein
VYCDPAQPVGMGGGVGPADGRGAGAPAESGLPQYWQKAEPGGLPPPHLLQTEAAIGSDEQAPLLIRYGSSARAWEYRRERP